MAGVPSLEGLRERFAEADRELQWWAEHPAEFVKLYPDQFVAVRDAVVVAAAATISELILSLKSQSLELRDVWMSYIDADRSRLIQRSRSQPSIARPVPVRTGLETCPAL